MVFSRKINWNQLTSARAKPLQHELESKAWFLQTASQQYTIYIQAFNKFTKKSSTN